MLLQTSIREADPDELLSIPQWLQDLGLTKYVRSFLKAEVDWESLLELSDQDLASIGVTALGPRKKLRMAIDQLKAEKSASTFWIIRNIIFVISQHFYFWQSKLNWESKAVTCILGDTVSKNQSVRFEQRFFRFLIFIFIFIFIFDLK